MNAEEIAEWADKNAWGADVLGGERRSYYLPELKRLAEVALQVPEGGCMVEIGVYGGRSLSCLLLAARQRNADVWAADPFVWNAELSEPRLMNLLEKSFWNIVDYPYHFCRMTSEEMRRIFPVIWIDLLHIDGDHLDVDHDCELWLPLLKSGGLVVFHDVVPDQRSPIYKLYLDVQKHTSTWETLWWATDEEGHQMCRRKP